MKTIKLFILLICLLLTGCSKDDGGSPTGAGNEPPISGNDIYVEITNAEIQTWFDYNGALRTKINNLTVCAYTYTGDHLTKVELWRNNSYDQCKNYQSSDIYSYTCGDYAPVSYFAKAYCGDVYKISAVKSY